MGLAFRFTRPLPQLEDLGEFRDEEFEGRRLTMIYSTRNIMPQLVT